MMTTPFNHLTVTILIMKFPGDPIGTKYTNSLASSTLDNRVNFVHFPPLPLDSFTGYKSIGELRNMVLDRHKPLVRDIFSTRSTTHRLAACIVSMLCTSIMDVLNEFGLPTYVFFASNAAYLGAMLHFQLLQDKYGEDVCELANSDSELAIPSYVNPIPPNVLPFPITDCYTWRTRILPAAQKCREAKGIIVNTFSELEHHALCSYDDKTPPVYAIGPILKPEPPAKNNETLKWLKDQPKSSVVLLCFGSRGSFSVNQVREIATAIERSGYRFLWSLRRPSTDGPKGFPCEYTDFSEVLLDGFLERTAKTGKVIGWIPQQVVLSNTAIGGFVSHCGWNSVLESLWYGVPLATWPLYAEQQLDAYQLVKDLGLAVEISLDYKYGNDDQKLAPTEDIENGIRRLMENHNNVRTNVSLLKNKSRMALKQGGSSFASLRSLVDDFSLIS